MPHPSRDRSNAASLAQLAATLALIALLVLLSPRLRAADDWDKTDYALGAAALAVTAVDWGQTRYIARHPARFQETNAILGPHPSLGAVNTYFISAIALGAVIAHHLPRQQRKWFLGGIAVVEIVVTHRNYRLGVGMDF